MSVDPFDLDEVGPPRDRWGRSLLVPKGGGERAPFTRCSTMANYVADHSGLNTWEKRLLAAGLGQREDLAAMAAGLPRLHAAKADKRNLSKAQLNEDKAVNAKLDEIIEEAMAHAGRNFKANHGTAVHSFTEPGADLTVVPSRMQDDVASWLQCLKAAGIEILATECYVVNDALQAAGTFDHLVRHPQHGIVVLDKKTGQVDGKGLAFSIQLATYANSVLYDWTTDERIPLESLTGGEPVNTRVGIIAHLPLGAGRCDLHEVDLVVGLHAAKLATNVRGARQTKDIMSPMPTGLPS